MRPRPNTQGDETMTSQWRRRGWTLAMLLMAVASSGALERVRGEDAKVISGDLRAMQGTWTFKPVEDVEVTWLMEGDTVKTSINGTEVVSKVTLDPAASPRTVDFLVSEGPEDVVGKTARGIYKIEGDRVTFCVRRPGEDRRPAEFKDVDDECFLFEIKKAK
jgi:uncharacterized protein (TIGR03067 family)